MHAQIDFINSLLGQTLRVQLGIILHTAGRSISKSAGRSVGRSARVQVRDCRGGNNGIFASNASSTIYRFNPFIHPIAVQGSNFTTFLQYAGSILDLPGFFLQLFLL
jgi:hypothetical protein